MTLCETCTSCAQSCGLHARRRICSFGFECGLEPRHVHDAPPAYACLPPQGYFTFWVILSIIWGLAASFICIFVPLWEARKTIIAFFKHVVYCEAPPKPQVGTRKECTR